jgi:hypothetical protein
MHGGQHKGDIKKGIGEKRKTSLKTRKCKDEKAIE